MGRYLVQRLIELIPVLLGVSIVVFMLVRLTGDPAAVLLPLDATEEAKQEFRREYGLDRPVAEQYVRFLFAAAQGDFGQSLRYRQPALELFSERIGATLELSAAALLISLSIGIPVGVYSAANRNSFGDSVVRVGSLLGQAIPVFYLGLVLIVIFSVELRLLPATGRGEWQHLLLPAITLATAMLALVARLTRYCVLEILSLDYVRTARAKGLAERAVLFGHVLKNALIPVVTVVGLQIGSLFSGAVVTETIFAWPGVGRLAVQAIYTRDFPLIQVTVIMTALIFLVVNLLVDLSYSWLDPRIRLR